MLQSEGAVGVLEPAPRAGATGGSTEGSKKNGVSSGRTRNNKDVGSKARWTSFDLRQR